MSIRLRIALLIGALFVFIFIAHRIKRNKIQMADAIYWVLLSALIVILGIFPQIAYFLSDVIGFLSPSNLVFATIIGLMLIKVFNNSCEVSMLKNKIDELTQEVALHEKSVSDNEVPGMCAEESAAPSERGESA